MRYCGCVFVVAWLCFCGCVFDFFYDCVFVGGVVAFLRFVGGAVVFGGGVVMSLWLCFCGGAFVARSVGEECCREVLYRSVVQK